MEKARKGYLAVVLDKQSHDELEKRMLAELQHAMPETFFTKCHHVTLEFGVYENQEHVAAANGRFVSMRVRGVYASEKCGAVTVQFDNAHDAALFNGQFAHVTMYVDADTKPKYSTELIKLSYPAEYWDMPLTGTIEFIPFEPQREPEATRIAASKEKPIVTCCGGVPVRNGRCPICGDKI